MALWLLYMWVGHMRASNYVCPCVCSNTSMHHMTVCTDIASACCVHIVYYTWLGVGGCMCLCLRPSRGAAGGGSGVGRCCLPSRQSGPALVRWLPAAGREGARVRRRGVNSEARLAQARPSPSARRPGAELVPAVLESSGPEPS